MSDDQPMDPAFQDALIAQRDFLTQGFQAEIESLKTDFAAELTKLRAQLPAASPPAASPAAPHLGIH